ncbi:OLC1v1025024C1 [Oldenlandia corymbosa var. corymbosa]|uniref:OLC1v1025024C1 n=1 Tax=Oldenlandia corymbosa var. corymbosa TaxID=529605 RepID=A0AAV1C3V8_OLDCO|nr:OLC1v1025024C1 [Oldenlandia corymbosa var. corymbosa]
MKEAIHKRRVAERCEGRPNVGVGSVGKVKVLMMQELDSSVSVNCLETRKRTYTLAIKSTAKSGREARAGKKVVHHIQCSPHRMPMLASEDIAGGERSPIRKGVLAERRRRSQLVEIVDLKCGNRLGKRSSSDPIASQIIRLRFSKLSG